MSDMAMLARFVSCPGTTFKFTVRYRDLRKWELGALLLVLTTEEESIRQLVTDLHLDGRSPELKNWLAKVSQWQPDPLKGRPLLALKLGHGRPLGMGSVSIRLEGAFRLRPDDRDATVREPASLKDLKANAVKDLAVKLRKIERPGDWTREVLLPWLKVHRFAGRTSGRGDYPRAGTD